MNISELFEELQNYFDPDELKGEFIQEGNCIIWTHNLDVDLIETDLSSNDDDEMFLFELSSSEELLMEAYKKDFKLLEEFLDSIEQNDIWHFSEPETNENIISFKIF